MVKPILLRCDGRDYRALGNLYAAAGKRAPLAVTRAVRRKGERAFGLMTREMRTLLGLRLKDVRRRLGRKMISKSSFEISARGLIRLEYFNTVQTPSGVKVPGVDESWIMGKDDLKIAFQAKKGKPANQPGNAAKRRGTLGGRIVYGVGKGRREGFRSVMGVMIPAAFVDSRVQGHFNKAAAELPAELAHQLWVVTEGIDIAASRARSARTGRAWRL
ncbi:hypothetical protein [Bosea sp. (in: a-proteobacteria)]|uniref:hypothetical protein n=1 Tax=Bosea sp. (in: a-proteobacteria) TaxID=1871050 RepID=UPI002733F0E2|nr:hypothetical protein [Bosea sp. (in: a-proteobacteria)]MDP3407249.1 hypothetical protein [Bosea sp. (in: a-proteobacteria)]